LDYKLRLINESTSNFLKFFVGLRQGCSLSLFLFFLVAKGLSMFIHEAKEEGSIKGVSVVDHVKITHLQFVDDILLLSEGSMREWRTFSSILNIFCLSIGMEVSINKSIMLCHDILMEVEIDICQLFAFRIGPIDGGLNFLGYFLKPYDFKVVDWMWFCKKVDSMINLWCHCWLSIEGRVVLLKSVLESIAIYWLYIAHVPKSILGNKEK